MKKNVAFCFLFALSSFGGHALAQSVKKEPSFCAKREFPAEVLRVIDGDTLEVLLDQGLGTYRKTHVRLLGIDTPETYGPKAERDIVRGIEATNFTREWSEKNNNRVEVTVEGNGKYGGRVIGTLYPVGGGKSLAESLRENGHEK
jgi:micrococcal nuclease